MQPHNGGDYASWCDEPNCILHGHGNWVSRAKALEEYKAVWMTAFQEGIQIHDSLTCIKKFRHEGILYTYSLLRYFYTQSLLNIYSYSLVHIFVSKMIIIPTLLEACNTIRHSLLLQNFKPDLSESMHPKGRLFTVKLSALLVSQRCTEVFFHIHIQHWPELAILSV